MKQLIFFIGLCIIITNPVNARFSESEEQIIQQIVHDYLNQNPDILYEIILNYSNQKSKEAEENAMSLTYETEGDGRFGNPNASLIIYEYSDYNCGYCKRVFEPIQQLLRDNPDVRLVIKEFPILSQSSLVAAKAAIATEIQGKFDEYHIAMMTYRGQITDAVVMRMAAQSGVDIEQLKSDMESPKTMAIIQRTREAAAALEINGTPGLVVGDTVVPGAIGLDELVKLIAEERNK